MLALSGIAAASASAALPEFQKEGKPLSEAVKFSGSSIALVASTGGATDECKQVSWAGETKGATEVAKVTAKFAECHNGYPCAKFEAKELKGKLGYVGKSGGSVVLLLEKATSPFAACTGGVGAGDELYGSLIGQLGPANTATKAFELSYQESKGSQELTEFDGESPVRKLELGAEGERWEGIGIGASPTLTMEKAIEIKS
jgi:hypothetical protein